MYYYAQLNESGVCVGVSALSGPVEAANMIPLMEQEYSDGAYYIGRPYIGGDWGGREPSVIDPPTPLPVSPSLGDIGAEVERILNKVLDERGL